MTISGPTVAFRAAAERVLAEAEIPPTAPSGIERQRWAGALAGGNSVSPTHGGHRSGAHDAHGFDDGDATIERQGGRLLERAWE